MRRIVTTIVLVVGVSVGIPLVMASSAPVTASDPIRPTPIGPDPAKATTRVIHSDSAKPGPRVETTRTEGIAGGLVYVPVNPYRTYDSRAYFDGFLRAGISDYFDVLSNEAGVRQIPVEARAVTYNLAVVGTAGAGGGFLAVYPADINWPGNASINWTAPGTILSNGGTVGIGFYTAPGQIQVYCGGIRVGTDYVIDITGYYM